ncbi:site-2 protease family protein [Treponema parvum]|uniref:Site-2 protease family protein n=1 Tax=Treponema parvum TaxID=138851 RepID=A0A975F3Y0_9SPIR|nr:site-2 protease family protein [Treponema parvum]QTQ13956.1 site-2 protease family protein [Treponema parvum]
MTIIYGLFLLCFLVFFHELGHFFVARLFKVQVEAFSIGMGPVLFHKKIKNTDYRLSLLPLGGYCGMKGEKDFSQAVEQGLSKIEAPKDSLYGVCPLKRALIAFAGPFFNLFFAFIAFTIIAMMGTFYYAPSAKIILADEIYPETDSAARKAGILTGDIIKEIDGNKVNDFSDIVELVSVRPDEDIKIRVERDGELLDFTVRSDINRSEGTGKIGVASSGDSEKREIKPLPFFPAILKGLRSTTDLIIITVKSIFVLFKGVEITNAVSGPARITTMLGDTVKDGFSAGIRAGTVNTLQFLAMISVSLFILNLLPIPVLDGGLIFFSLVELVFRRQIPPKIQYYVQYVGLAIIAFIFIIGISGDIRYFILSAGKK